MKKVNWSEISHFTPKEFKCKCGCGLCNPAPTLVKALDALRKAVGFPLHINSGCRCLKHNIKVGGKPNSEHCIVLRTGEIICYAADIECSTSRQRFVLLKHAPIYFARIGVGSNFMHLGCYPLKDQDVAWTY